MTVFSETIRDDCFIIAVNPFSQCGDFQLVGLILSPLDKGLTFLHVLWISLLKIGEQSKLENITVQEYNGL
jgi:hypothetical protein